MALSRRGSIVIAACVLLLLLFGLGGKTGYSTYTDKYGNPFKGVSSKVSNLVHGGPVGASAVGYRQGGCGKQPKEEQGNGKTNEGDSWVWNDIGHDPTRCFNYWLEGDVQPVKSFEIDQSGCLVRFYADTECSDEDGIELVSTEAGKCLDLTGKSTLKPAKVAFEVESSHTFGNGPLSFEVNCLPDKSEHTHDMDSYKRAKRRQ
jgi:hypothetical protein